MNLNLERIAIVYNPKIAGAKDFSFELKNKFKGEDIFCTDDLGTNNSNISFIITVGGDGTILKAARHASIFNIPILGFNLGRLGYLAQANPEEAQDVINKIKNDNFIIQERLMLEAKTENQTLTALNDIVIKGAVFSRTSALNLYINDIPVSNYLADGLIISTPTGSTAYTLSAGGPVVSPDLNAFIIVPICPHTLSARPLVIPDSETVRIEMSDCNKFQVTSDGQTAIEVKNSIELKKYDKKAKLVILDKCENNFYNVLREKLHWGIRPDK